MLRQPSSDAESDDARLPSITIPPEACETFMIGSNKARFTVRTSLLFDNSPVFSAMVQQAPHGESQTVVSNILGPLILPEVDDFAFSNFCQWLDNGVLHQPWNYHSLNHHICLYTFANKFGFEQLENLVMDQVRQYYHSNSMSAPPSRLVYIYQGTNGPCLMREFLVYTAAQRAVTKSERENRNAVTRHMRELIAKGGKFSTDYVDAVIALHLTPGLDVRGGNVCRWHKHVHSAPCN